jgi:hypothetical protein
MSVAIAHLDVRGAVGPRQGNATAPFEESAQRQQPQQEQAEHWVESYIEDIAEDAALGMASLPPEQAPADATQQQQADQDWRAETAGAGAQDPNSYAAQAFAAAMRATGAFVWPLVVHPQPITCMALLQSGLLMAM